MSGPQAPRDQELKNIIDKLANFVARNGVEFERMTKQKQKDNPKFQFLFGGEYFDYYSYRVAAEQTLHQQQQQMPPPGPPFQPTNAGPPFQGQMGSHPHQSPPNAAGGPHQPPPFHPIHNMHPPLPNGHSMHMPTTSHPQHHIAPPNPHQLPPMSSMRPPLPPNPAGQYSGPPVEFLQQQIQTSLANLQAQQQVLGNEQETKVRQLIEQKVGESLDSVSKQMKIDVSEIDRIISPIVESCTKDAISAGKQCFLNVSANSQSHCDFMSLYLLNEVLNKTTTFDGRLHIIYLINDIVHHCFRKGNKELQDAIEDVVVSVFQLANQAALQDSEKIQKLTKLVTLWTTHKYFHQSVLEKLRQTNELKWIEFACKHIESFKDEIQGIQASTQARIIALTQQHDSFVAHLEQQMAAANAASQQYMPPRQPPPFNHQNPNMHQPPHMPYHGHPPTHYPNMPPPHQMGSSYPPHPQNIENSSNGQSMAHTELGYNMPSNGSNENQEGGEESEEPYLSNSKFYDYNHKLENVPPHLRAPNDDELPEIKHEIYEYDHGNSRPLDDPSAKNRFPVPKEPPIESLVPTAPYWDLPAGLMVPLINLKDVDFEPIDPKDLRLPPAIPPSNRLLAALDAFYAHPTPDRPRNLEGWEHGALTEYYKAKSKYTENRGPTKSIKIQPYVEELLKNHVIELPPHKPRLPLSRTRRTSPEPVPSFRASRRRSPRSRSRSKSRSRSYSRSRSRSSSSSSDGSRGPTSARPLKVSRRSADSKLEESNVGHQLLKKMGWGGSGLGKEEQGIQEPIKPKPATMSSSVFPLFKGHVPAPGLSTVVPPKSEIPVAPILANLTPDSAKRLEDKRAEFQRKAAELLQKAKGPDNS